MSGFTPGPWTVEPLQGKYYGTHVALPDGNQVTVWTPDHYAAPFGSPREVEQGWEPEDGHDHVEDVRSYANARLIAAAPDLLAALVELVRQHKSLRAAESYPTTSSPATDAADAAIAKATGEAR